MKLEPQICHLYLFSFPLVSEYADQLLSEGLCWSHGGHGRTSFGSLVWDIFRIAD
jgi:hypothetical protein